MTEHRMALRPEVRARNDAYSYVCHGCGHCCHHKAIRVSPYEVARLGDVLGESTTTVLARDIDPEMSTLRTTAEGACTYLRGTGCAVHAGRPLACRLYPLGWIVTADGDEAFTEFEGHPRSAGLTGADGTVADYVDAQGTAPYMDAARRYEAVLHRLRLAIEVDGPDPGDSPPLADVDAAVEGDCARRGVAVPEGVESRVDCHLALLHGWLDAAGAPSV